MNVLAIGIVTALLIIAFLLILIYFLGKEVDKQSKRIANLHKSNDTMSSIIREANIREVPPKDLD